jgi:hypothetical protein
MQQAHEEQFDDIFGQVCILVQYLICSTFPNLFNDMSKWMGFMDTHRAQRQAKKDFISQQCFVGHVQTGWVSP